MHWKKAFQKRNHKDLKIQKKGKNNLISKIYKNKLSHNFSYKPAK